MRALRMLLVLLLAGPAVPATADLVTDLSESKVKVSYRYEGKTLLVFGNLPEAGGHVLLEVRGPERSRTLQRKGKVAGLWMNVESMEIQGVPGYYALLSDVPLDELMPAGQRQRLGIGREALFRHARLEGKAAKATPEAYFEGLIDHMRDIGLYRMEPGSVQVRRGRLFRAELRMPSRVPVGEYRIVTRQVKDGEVIHRDERQLSVAKTGIEKWLYDMAHDHPAWYGLMAIAVALFAGWFVGMITRGEAEH
ncbi:MAG TPA: TIGR02186 family protein [Gammaproteobacteria bacterium]|nr:TIGR02186 family protein [Gammaproteobacteria bacterium]